MVQHLIFLGAGALFSDGEGFLQHPAASSCNKIASGKGRLEVTSYPGLVENPGCRKFPITGDHWILFLQCYLMLNLKIRYNDKLDFMG